MTRRARIGWVLLAVCAVSLRVTPARALDVPVVFNGPSGFGVSAGTAAAVEAAGFSLITDAPISPTNMVPLVIPAPDVLSSHLVGSPSVSHPNRAQSRWTVTNGGDEDLQDAWIVFLTPLTYTKSKVGIDLQGGGEWALVEVPVGKDEYFYPAVFLGDIGADAATTFLMNHVVGQQLTQQGSKLILPQYQIGLITGVPLPEPALCLLLAAALTLAAGVRRGEG